MFYDHIRRHQPTEDLPASSIPQRKAETSDEGLSLDLYAALNLLTPHERTCITLQLIEGQSIDRIAQITGMVQGTVKSHLFRGKEKMATYLKQNGYD